MPYLKFKHGLEAIVAKVRAETETLAGQGRGQLGESKMYAPAYTNQSHSEQHVPAQFPLTTGLPIRPGAMTIGPDLAKRILTEAAFEGQRVTAPVFVERHVENLKRGLWLDGSQIAFGRVGDNYYLVNGKHRMTAIVQWGRPAEFSVLVHPCANMEEVRSLYARYDNVQRPRTSTQIIAASDLQGQMGVGVAFAQATYGAVPFLLNGLKPLYHNDPATERLRIDLGLVDFRIAVALAWTEQTKIYERCIAPAEGRLRKKLLLPSVTAIALYTLKHAKQLAVDFWSGTALNDGLRRGDPRQALVNYVLSTDFKSKESGGGTQAVALAWNAWMDNKTVTTLRPTSLTKLALAGTPLRGR